MTTVTFTFAKETKTKLRYDAKGDVSGSIYVDQGSDLGQGNEIVLEVVPADEPAEATA